MNDSPSHTQDAPKNNAAPASRWHCCTALFRTFAMVSAISLGGGLVMIPVIQKEFVEKRHWLSENDMLDTIALTQSLPGIIAVNISSLIGYRIAGVPGVLAAVLGVVFPPFTTIVIIAAMLFNFMDTRAVQCIFTGVRAGVCAMVLASVIKLAKKTLTGPFEITVAIAGFLALVLQQADILWLLVASAAAGIAVSWKLWQGTELKTECQKTEKGGHRP